MVVGEFLFLVTKNLKSRRLDLLSNHEICFQNFSFSSRNWRKLQISRFFLQKFSFSSRTRKQISTFLFSVLEIRDMDSIFLFLFSILLFDIQSMPGEKSNKCNQYDYATAYASALRKHLIMHSGEKSNKCNQCDYASCRASDLRTHLKTHSGENPNKCNQCVTLHPFKQAI